MAIIGQHVNFALTDRAIISPDAVAHRRAARGLLQAARPYALLAFRIADTHAHLLFWKDVAPEAVRRVKLALFQAVQPRSTFGPAHFEPVRGQAHLYRAFRYVLGQDVHHGFAHDPFAEASNLPDLLGLRELGAWTRQEVRRHLPRVDHAELLGLLGVDDLQPDPVPAGELVEATLAAAALGVLRGKGREVVAARVAALHSTEARAVQVAAVMGLSARSLQGLRHREPDAALVRAVRLQAALRRRTEPMMLGEPGPASSTGPTEMEEARMPLP